MRWATDAHDTTCCFGFTRNVVGDLREMDRLTLDKPDDDPHPYSKPLQVQSRIVGGELGVDLGE
jgi:hypothetical protein